jgi:hypothetical protein
LGKRQFPWSCLNSTLSKIKNFVILLVGQNPSFLAKTFSISLFYGEIEKLKLPPDKGFSKAIALLENE